MPTFPEGKYIIFRDGVVRNRFDSDKRLKISKSHKIPSVAFQDRFHRTYYQVARLLAIAFKKATLRDTIEYIDDDEQNYSLTNLRVVKAAPDVKEVEPPVKRRRVLYSAEVSIGEDMTVRVTADSIKKLEERMAAIPG